MNSAPWASRTPTAGNFSSWASRQASISVYSKSVSTPRTTPWQATTTERCSGTLGVHPSNNGRVYVESFGAAAAPVVAAASGSNSSRLDILASSNAINVVLSHCSGFKPLATAVVSSDNSTA